MAIPIPVTSNAIKWTKAIPPAGRSWVDLKNHVALKLAYGGYYYIPPSTLAGKIILPPEVTSMHQTLLNAPPQTRLQWTIWESPEFTQTPFTWYYRLAVPAENRIQYAYSGYAPPAAEAARRIFRIDWPSGWIQLTPSYSKPINTYTQTIGGHFTVWSLRLSPNQVNIQDLPLAPPWHREDFP